MRIAILISVFLLSSSAFAETAFIEATQDNTLYESVEGELSNGAGDHFFVGRTAAEEIRRGLIAFKDLSAIPAGATIQSVELHLRVSVEVTPPTTVNLLRVLANWGEGDSHAAGEEGQGGAAQPGDATWIHRFFDNQTWTTPGGDFAEVASASREVDAVGPYAFGSTSAMVADVQDWKANPNTNFGWILIAAEDTNSAKRFDSRTNADEAFRPVLEVEFSATGSPFDYSGLWYDPSLDGEGYIVYETPYGWLIYFFGYSADGQFLWLVSDIVPLDHLQFGVPFELPLLIGAPGTFDEPTPSTELQPWGTLSVTFNSCTSGVFKLEGLDGEKTSNAVKLVGVEDTGCLEL
jgi:hypothetical protein